MLHDTTISPLGLLALASAACTALSGIIVAETVRRVGGSLALSRIQMLVATVGLGLAVTAVGGWGTIRHEHVVPLALSSLFAVVLGSPAYNGSMALLGARRTTLLFSLNAPLGALFAWLILGEALGPSTLVGGALVLAGIVLAVAFGYPAGGGRPSAHDELGATAAGLLVGLAAAALQAAGNLAARPAVADGIDPFAAMWIRVAVAGLCFLAFWPFEPRRKPGAARATPRDLAVVAFGTMMGLGLGMSLLMAALAATGVGVASTLQATAPVVVLPMLWLRTGRAAPWPAWAGAAIATLGTGVIFLGPLLLG